MNFIKKSKGVISIFLILILIPVMTMSVVLVDGSRARSAKAITEEISDLAAMSVLTNYNTKLKDDFGLFAINKGCDVQAVYEEYLKASLSANEGTKASDLTSDKLNNLVYNYNNKYNNAEFWNMYNFNIENTAVKASKDLTDPDVLKNQIVEYSKYRGPVLLSDRLEIMTKINNIKDGMKNNKKTLDLLKEKEEIDKTSKVEESFFSIKRLVNDYNSNLKELKKSEDVGAIEKKIEGILAEYNKCLSNIDEMIKKYSDFYNTKKSSEEEEVLKETQEDQENYESYKTQISNQKEKIEEIKNKIEEINKLKNKVNDSEDSDSENKASKISEEIDKLEEIDFKNPLEVKAQNNTTPKPSDDELNKLGVDKNKKDTNVKKPKSEEKEKVTLEDSVYNELPSNEKGNDSEDEEEDTSTTNMDKVSSPLSFLGNIGEDIRDDALVYSYILGTFKTRVTEKNITSDKLPTGVSKDDDCYVKWRYENADGEHDLRGNPKKDRITKFNTSETEYIIAGKKEEQKNESSVYARIYAVRMVNNLAAVYMSTEVKEQCHAAALAASLATEGALPEPLFYHMFMVAWASGETALDLHYLIENGYKVPVIKKASNLYIKNLVDVATAISSPKTLADKYTITKSDFMITYEDYLVLFLMTVPEDTRLRRVSDLIQLNMEKSGQEDFKMREANTYVEADSEVSIKYLFSNVSQFDWGYNKKGISFNNKVYEGY